MAMLHYHEQQFTDGMLHFRSGRESGKLKDGPGAPHTKLTDRTVNTAAAIMQDDARMMVRDLANILQIVVGSTHQLLTEILGLSHVCARCIPQLLGQA